MILADDIEAALAALPAVLVERVRHQCEDWYQSHHAEALPPAMRRQCPQVWACSRYVAQTCQRHPQWLKTYATPEGISAPLPDEYAGLLELAMESVNDLASLKRALREFRHQSMLRLAWRDLAGLDDLDTTLQGLSALADALVNAALQWLEARQVERYGQPRDSGGRPMGLVVLGMGKLGGRELNFSSDIDLVFAYPEAGTTPGPRAVSHEEYFRGLAQQLVQALNEHTEDGFVFRVDTRLRPFGDSGPLVMHFDAMEQYYQTHGREWERYAWIKARPIAGDLTRAERLMQQLRPFVFRRYLDFGVYESLRDMKAMIARETRRKGLQNNIKLGRGGIREIEFIAQVFQLIRGGQEATLQDRGLRKILAQLAGHGLLPAEAVAELDAAYVFLRRLENRMQAFADQQTHDLPDDAEQQAALALAMGVTDWPALWQQVADWREKVAGHFERVFGQADANVGENADLQALWQGGMDPEVAGQLLQTLGFNDDAALFNTLEGLRNHARIRSLGEAARRRLNECVPLLIQAAGQTADPDLVVRRMLDLLLALVGRSTYLSLLIENPTAIPQMARLCEASPWIAEQLAQYPMLLDSLLDPRILYTPPGRAELEQELGRQVAQTAADDLERLMDCVRRFKHRAVLRVAAADVSEAVPLMIVSDHLTEIAEVVLNQALLATRMQLLAAHGRPVRADGSEAGFAVIAYGKFGGLELGYGSDLDLVFVHDGERDGMTDGPRPLTHDSYFIRLGQRLIHFLTAFTPAGRAYEVDMRLRPNGEAGLLVTGIDALASYQRQRAWTWEHQALVRARPVAGSASLREQFTKLRREILSQTREADALRQDVIDMRDKMRRNLERHETGRIDLKQGVGGITDIEFLAQYSVLRWASQYPDLTVYPDNIRVFEGLAEAGLWEASDVTAICEAYRTLRRLIHRCALQNQAAMADVQTVKAQTAQVVRCWGHYLLAE